MIEFWKRYNITIVLFTLVFSLSGLSFYNYLIQKNLLLEQMRNDAQDTAGSIIAAMNRFHDIKSTMKVQKLVSDISLGLEIFEFRYIEPDGVIRNSMFKEEIGTVYQGKSFQETRTGTIPMGKFFFETRDFVPVMSIYYPIRMDDQLIGIVDLCVDISEYKILLSPAQTDFLLMRRQVDILNLLKSIEGSVHNSVEITSKTDFHNFLKKYVETANNIIQISLVDQQHRIIMSNEGSIIGKRVDRTYVSSTEIFEMNGRPTYRIVMPDINMNGSKKKEQLILLLDAGSYVKNEHRILRTALLTSAMAILFALFIARIIYYSAIESSRKETERLEQLVKERTQAIEFLSKTDALTGLWNRGYLEEMMELEFKRSRRYHKDMAIMVIDLDYFKKINDTYGHLGGDEVLRRVGKSLLSGLRETDFIGRYGGEEIVVILSETRAEKAFELANKICSDIASEPIEFGDAVIWVTVSIGVSALRPEHTTYEEIFSEADDALYASKNNGRNRVGLYSHS
ncbi:MAG: GGDEF domain-containing protein [Sulfuricurvum sp.]|jgi:diguanylate cyclase (GGDEF)-like protein|uniref:GGDEF domain-containing protein n=1 Tax=Sulfuricurvum sp. TaxID=2025608 RepID=UPI0025E882F5|nr:GGDEF domain-containing protein [Sulfuricurvum sp.]MCK9372043.1 GGDEF domain-containing protein [Sulfuricurvum sp.]